MDEKLEKKYARMWHQTNSWEIPEGLDPFNRHDVSSRYLRDLYVSGMWKVFNMMAEDGLISQEMLRRIHDEQPGMKPGQSRITIRVKK